MAALANATHGLSLKPKERLRAFRLFMDMEGNVKPGGVLMSYQEIALALGGNSGRTTIFRWMLKYYPAIAEMMARAPMPMRSSSPRLSPTPMPTSWPW
jgi:hypothetical protein